MYTPSLTIDNVIDALGTFIDPFVTPAKVVRGEVNRAAMPSGSFVLLTEILQIDLSVPTETYQPLVNTAEVVGSKEIHIQIDFYGESSGDWCNVIKNVFRSTWGFDHFPAGIKPLYTSDGVQAPLTSGEQQYVRRWTLTAKMQYNPSVTLPQQFADALVMANVDPADV